jgi:hypothetical protein
MSRTPLSPDDMMTGPIADLVRHVLDLGETDRNQFWLLTGVICGRLSGIKTDPETLALWRAAHVDPHGDYETAVRLLNSLIGRNTCK